MNTKLRKLNKKSIYKKIFLTFLRGKVESKSLCLIYKTIMWNVGFTYSLWAFFCVPFCNLFFYGCLILVRLFRLSGSSSEIFGSI